MTLEPGRLGAGLVREIVKKDLEALAERSGALFVRRAEKDDMAFVLDSWLKSYASSPAAIALRGNYYERGEVWARALVESSRTLVATDEDAPDVILGWLCCEPPKRVHYVYVRNAARRRGVATCLLEAAGIQKTGVYYSCSPQKKLRAIVGALGWQWLPIPISDPNHNRATPADNRVLEAAKKVAADNRELLEAVAKR